MASAGFLIYSGVMPLIKTFIAIFFGFLLAKRGLFPLPASRGASQVTMNISLPCLLFANIVPAFNHENVSAIGPLMLLAIVYVTLGFGMGLVVRETCYVPRNFWQGIVVLCGLSNWGNLPNAVVTTVTMQAPFDPATDPALGVSYVAIFIVCYHIVFWVFGAAASLAWDYAPGVPQGADAEARLSWDQKPLGAWVARRLLGRRPRELPWDLKDEEGAEKEGAMGKSDGREAEKDVEGGAGEYPAVFAEAGDVDPDVQLARQASRLSAGAASFRSRRPSARRASASRPKVEPPSTIASAAQSHEDLGLAQSQSHPAASSSAALPSPRPGILARALAPVRVVVTPITLTIAVALPVALITPLKALFVDVSASDPSGKYAFHGPDGNPPLAFVIDTASFLGGITIPMALVLLGASFARLSVPRPLARLPLPAMFAAAAAKLFVLPVIGVFVVQAMVKRGMIAEDAKVERFVATFLSGTPAAVNQLIVSQLYSPDGNVDTLSAFLLVQYVLMFLSSSALTAVSLLLV